MKGDFTRGIQPDRKRGKRYRRVLVQQARVLLDSDVASLVDGIDHELRQVTADLGCQLGSPDLGYLITPGRLLALFEHATGVTTSGGGTAMRDYSRKYPDEPEGRYPSLRVQGAGGTTTIALREAVTGPLAVVLWCRADVATTLTVAAGAATAAITVPAATSWQRVVASLSLPTTAVTASLAITGAATPAWLGLIELDERVDAGPHLWAAAGRFHARGLTPALATATGYPEVSYPAAAGFVATDGGLLGTPRVVAYLETWERDITWVEDPGIREVALSKVDTTVRTEVVGQVKWASAAGLTADELRRAFRAVAPPTSRLVVHAPTTPPSTDPCALPTTGGYTGADHRLYRFEVHRGGAAIDARIKWSRDNGCHLFPVVERTGLTLTLARASGLADGDLVEILSDVIDLGDTDAATSTTSRAQVTATAVTPAQRATGALARVRQQDADSQGRDVFELSLLAPYASLPAALYPPTQPLRLRRWDGLAVPATSGAGITATVEDGIELTLSGTFAPGEYWQYEARRGPANTGGPWRAAPHGPERILAPLALLTIGAGAAPATLVAWLDHRFSPLCELDGDDVAFDGTRIDSDADTVQEALEELYERDRGSCCDATLGPNGRSGDDAARITAAIGATTFSEGGHLCLEPGVYDLRTTIVIDRDVVVRGCPEATLLGHGTSPLFRVTGTGRLRLEQLVLDRARATTGSVLVELAEGARLVAREVGFLARTAADGDATAIARAATSFVAPDLDASNDPALDADHLPPSEVEGTHVELRDCVVLAEVGVRGSRFAELTAERTAFVFATARGAISASQVDQLRLHDCSFRGGLAAHVFDGFEPELLRGRTDDLLERAAALAGGGVAVSIGFLLGGALARNHLRCQLGLWARVARDLAIRDDVFHQPEGQSYGVRVHHARRIDLEGLRIDAMSGIEVPLSARQVTVRRCVIRGRSAGITFAGEARELFNAGPIVGVVIDGNHVETPDRGVAIGASGTRASEVDDVRISGNVIRTTTGIPAATAITIVGDGNLAGAVVVDDNEVTTDRVAIRVAGAGGVVRGNQLRLTANSGPAVTAAGTAGIGQVAIVDNVVTGTTNAFTAFQLHDTPDARVTGNQVRTTAASHVLSHPAALDLRGTGASARQYIVGNDFAIGGVTIRGASNLHLVGNTIRVLLVDSGPSGRNGVVHGNQLGGILIFIIPVSASLTGLRGMWKISDNLAPAPVVVAGATHEELIWHGFFADLGTYSMIGAAMAAVEPEARARMVVEPPEVEATPRPRRDDAGLAYRDAITPPPASALLGAEHVRADRLVDEVIREAGREVFRPVEDFLVATPVLFHTITVVDPFDFHVSGNRFGMLVVEAASGQTATTDSSAHVVDNKVTLNLDVEMTSAQTQLDNIVAVNSAAAFSPPVAATTTPILYPNLRR